MRETQSKSAARINIGQELRNRSAETHSTP